MRGARTQRALFVVPSRVDDGYLGRRGQGQKASETGVIDNLDRPFVSVESRSHIETDGSRMVEGAGFDEKALHRRPECPADGLFHQHPPYALAGRAGHETEIRELRHVPGPEIQFEEADIGAVFDQRVRFDVYVGQNVVDGRVALDSSTEP